MQICMQYRVVAADAFSTQRQLLWDLCYRVTGTVADADMLVRDCFAKAVERPQIEGDADWRAHLLRPAAALAVEALRNRTRRQYSAPGSPHLVRRATPRPLAPDPRPPAARGTTWSKAERSRFSGRSRRSIRASASSS
jgi:DNA-directed RNA polymerase specialized sigma24 family protein